MDVPFARQQPLDSYQSVQNGADAKSVANAEDPIFIPHHHHKEEHPTIANVSSVVLGAMDGVVTCFCLVASSVGIGLSGVTIFTLGLATLAGDAISMGMAEFLSKRAEENIIESETEREWNEMQVIPEEEKDEMEVILTEKGMSPENARQVIDIMWQNPKMFLEWMMMYELQLIPTEEMLEAKTRPHPGIQQKPGWDWPGMESPVGAGITTLIAFFLLGSVPLIPFLFTNNHHSVARDEPVIWMSLLLSIVAMYLLGWGKSKLIHKTDHTHWIDGAVAAGYGTVASLLAFFIGDYLGGKLQGE